MHSIHTHLPAQKQAYCQQLTASSSICRTPKSSRRLVCHALAATATRGPVKESAGVSYQGTARKRNEDRYALQVRPQDQSHKTNCLSDVQRLGGIVSSLRCICSTCTALLCWHKCTRLLQVEGDDSKLFYAGVFDGHGKVLLALPILIWPRCSSVLCGLIKDEMIKPLSRP